MALGDLLEHTLGRRTELVTLESLSPFLGPHILAEAQTLQRALVRSLEVIGEATKRVPSDIRVAHPD